MKKLKLVLILSVGVLFAFSCKTRKQEVVQKSDKDSTTHKVSLKNEIRNNGKPKVVKISKDTTLTSPEKMPEFRGGEAGLLNYISTHTHYPTVARNYNIQGKVMVRFVVDSKGHVIRPSVVKSVHRSLDEEALRVVKSLPDFKPGYQDGKPVAVWYVIPFEFYLRD